MEGIGFELLRTLKDVSEAGRDDVLYIVFSCVHVLDKVLEGTRRVFELLFQGCGNLVANVLYGIQQFCLVVFDGFGEEVPIRLEILAHWRDDLRVPIA